VVGKSREIEIHELQSLNHKAVKILG